ncbi:MAG: SDR family NAD(P)-dependent oxidoreductase [Chloroflexota bacterium]
MPKTQSKLPPRSTPLSPRRRAVIVGASSGIGAALARRLARQGYTLALLARSEDLLVELCGEINSLSGETRALFYLHDVAEFASVPALLHQILADLGGLDLFIYNTGISLSPGPQGYDFSKDRRTTEVNYLGALAWLNPVADMFQSLGAGQIVGIGSVAGDRGRVGNPAYNASKAALATYLEALRNRLTRRGVDVLTVKPGFVDTEMLKGSKTTFWVISPEQAAADIWRAIRRRRQEVYTPARWRMVMFVVRNIPSIIFRRLNF